MVAQTYDLLERLSHLLRGELRASATQAGLKLVQLEALHYLLVANRYSDTPIAVAEALSLTKGTVSQTLSTLETKGLIEKHTDGTDGRVTHCRLTRKGRRLAEASHPPALLEAAVERLGTDASLLQGLLAELLRHLQREHGGRSFGVCHSCRHHQGQGSRARCGLTGERLTPQETLLRCREHELPA